MQAESQFLNGLKLPALSQIVAANVLNSLRQQLECLKRVYLVNQLNDRSQIDYIEEGTFQKAVAK